MINITFEQGTGFAPRIVRITTNATISQITTTGWLDGSGEFKPTDCFCIAYSQGTTLADVGFFDISISDGIITLSQDKSGLPTPTVVSSVLTTNSSGVLEYTRGEIPGTQTNNDAAAGNVGEYIQSIIGSGSAVALVSGVSKDVTSIALTAGDWDLSGSVWYDPAATTAITSRQAWIGTSSASSPTPPGTGPFSVDNSLVEVGSPYSSLNIPLGRISIAAAGTAYLSCSSDFTVDTCAAYGIIRARRVR